MNDYVNPAILTTPMLPPIGGSIVQSWGPPPGSAPPMDAGDAGQPIADRETLDQAGDQLQRFGAAVGGAYQSSLLDGNSNAREMALERAVEERNATVKAATGADLENPMRDGYLGEALYRWRQETGQSFANDQPGLQGVDIGGLSPSEQSRVHDLQLQVYQEKIDALTKQYPSVSGDISARAGDIANEAVANADATSKTLPGAAGFAAGLIGGLGASFRDPLQLAALTLGGGEATAFKSIAGQMLETFVKQGAINAGVQTLSEGKIADWRAERGQPMSGLDMLTDVGTSALFGGALGAGLHGAHALIGLAARGDPKAAAELAARLPERQAGELRQALHSVVDDADAVDPPPAGVDPEAGRAALRDAARGMENPDAPLAQTSELGDERAAPPSSPADAGAARADAAPAEGARRGPLTIQWGEYAPLRNDPFAPKMGAIRDTLGNEIGYLLASENAADRTRVRLDDIRMREPGQELSPVDPFRAELYDGGNGEEARLRAMQGQLGVGGLRDLLTEVKKQFPDAQQLDGFRITGARAQGGRLGRATINLPSLEDLAARRERARAARAAAAPEAISRTLGSDQPANARTLPETQERPPVAANPEPKPEGEAATPNGQGEEGGGATTTLERLQSYVDDLRQRFGVTPEIKLKPGHTLFFNQAAIAERWQQVNRATGEVLSRQGIIRVDHTLSPEHQLALATHEFGHMLQHYVFDELPEGDRAEIMAAFERDTGAEVPRGSEPDFIARQLGAPIDAALTEFRRQNPARPQTPNAEDVTYNKKFNEWFANQVSKFLTTNREAVSVADRFFKGVADLWRKLYEHFTGRAGAEPEVEAFLRRQGKFFETPAAEKRVAANPEPKPEGEAAAPVKTRRAQPLGQGAPRSLETLRAYVKRMGGVQNQGGELTDLVRRYPGLINNRRGLTMDRMRELVAQAGYLHEYVGDVSNIVGETLPTHLAEALRDEQPHYALSHVGGAIERDERSADLANRRQAREQVDAEFHDMGHGADAEWRDHAAELLAQNPDMHPGDAIERAAIELEERRAAASEDAARGEQLPERDIEGLEQLHDETYGGAREGDRSGEANADRGVADAVPGADQRAAERAELYAGLDPSDPLARIPVVRDGKVELIAPDQVGARVERQDFMAGLIENCIL